MRSLFPAFIIVMATASLPGADEETHPSLSADCTILPISPEKRPNQYLICLKIEDLSTPKHPKLVAAPQLLVLLGKPGFISIGDLTCNVHVREQNGERACVQVDVSVLKGGKLVLDEKSVTVQKTASKKIQLRTPGRPADSGKEPAKSDDRQPAHSPKQ